MSEPSRDSRPLADLLSDYEVSVADEPGAQVYVATGLSSRVWWIRGDDGVVRMFVDGMEVRDAWWRRAMNWLWRRLSGQG